MPHSYYGTEQGPISEMAIVDTFTKLIFGEEEGYCASELSIIQALRMVDANVLLDCHRDMGAYLRALGVQEMVQLVARVREQLLCSLPLSPAREGQVRLDSAAAGTLDRRSH